jgi:hypothetical protein
LYFFLFFLFPFIFFLFVESGFEMLDGFRLSSHAINTVVFNSMPDNSVRRISVRRLTVESVFWLACRPSGGRWPAVRWAVAARAAARAAAEA